MTQTRTDNRKEVFLKAYRHLVESGEFKRLLTYRAGGSLARFSLNNIMLVMWQAAITKQDMPTILKTYKQWQDVGRQVQRHEHGWYIYGPHFRKTKNDEGEEEQRLTGFHIVHEFDITQTEGEPYHEPASPLATSDHEELMHELVAKVQATGISVVWGDHNEGGGALGSWDKQRKRITVREDLAPDEQLAVLIHELIHAQGVDYQKYTRKDAEVITETAAAIVCLGIGLDTTEQATDYVAWWAGQDPERAIQVLDEAEQEARTLERTLGLRPARKEMALA